MHKLLASLCCIALCAQLVIASAYASSDDPRRHLRIVALAPHLVESLYAIGAGEQIIATTEHADFPAAALDIPRVGNYARLQIERIIELNPDVVIAWHTGNPEDDLERLQRYGVKLVSSTATHLEHVADEILLLGEITGRQATAQAIASDYSAKLAALRQRYASATPVVGFYEMWARPLRTVANQAWLQQQLEVCGVDNPFKHALEDYPLISLEKVLAYNPQIVIQPSTHSATAPDALQWQQWPSIAAVRHQFIFHPNADKTHRMTTRVLDELQILCAQVDKARQVYAASD